MTRFTNRAVQLVAVAPVALVLVAGCSSSGSGSGATTSPTNGASSSSPQSSGAGAGTAITATESEFKIDLSVKTFKAGAYTFTINNTGKFPHNLTIEGPGVDKTASSNVAAGSSGTLTVTLQKGSYEVSCSVDGHKGKGMDMKIQVS